MLVTLVMAKYTSLLIACGLGILACSGATTKTAAGPQSASAAIKPPHPVALRSSEAPTPPAWTGEQAHRLVIAAAACWLGGVWSDAEGVDASARAADAEKRCRRLVESVYGTYDPARYERLRAIERVEVSDLRSKILSVAKVDSIDRERGQQLGTFLDAIADAERETMIGRLAADRVKKDSEGSADHMKLTIDENAAVTPLNDARAFEALLGLEMGELTPEARAVAILCAMDRMDTARGLIPHLKVYALARPFTVLFNTTTPALAADEPPVGGVWLAYITAVAGAAEHPVSDMARAPTDRETLAWGGALEGLADKLHAETEQMSNTTDLKRVAENIVRRIDADYRASEAVILHEKDNQEEQPSARPSPKG